MMETIILIAVAVLLLILLAKVVTGGLQSGSGSGSVNMLYGATQELLTHDQQKAMEIIVKKQCGEEEESQESGELNCKIQEPVKP